MPVPSIPTGVVSVKVFINGTVLSNVVALQNINVGKTFNKVAWAKLAFDDGTAAARDFPLSDNAMMKPGSEVKIQLGFDGSAATVFEGIIVKHSIKIRQVGPSMLVIEAKDKAIKLTSARKSKYFSNQKDSDVITDLGSAFSPQVDATNTLYPQLVQFDCTDWDFMLTRAEANSMLVLTDDNKLIVKKPDTTIPSVFAATYGVNILDFDSEMDAQRQALSITAHAWDYTKQQVEQSGSGVATFTENGNIPSTDLAPVLATEIALNSTGHLTQHQLQDWSDAYQLRNQLSKAVGRVRVVGNSDVKPGTMITLDGVGDRFNGNVFVTGILHQYNGAWTTDIQFGWREDWFYKKENVMDKPAAGLLPGITGLQVGIVVDLDDAENQFRIKVHIPSITSGNEGIWARVATLDAGANRGVYFRPAVGDEVVLGFLNDDPREPIVLGCMHSKDNKASPLPDKKGSLQSGFVTKEGLKLVFDDTDKTMTLTVPTGSGEKSITINDKSGAMELKDEHNNSIKMDSSGITIEAGAGNVTIKGLQVAIN